MNTKGGDICRSDALSADPVLTAEGIGGAYYDGYRGAHLAFEQERLGSSKGDEKPAYWVTGADGVRRINGHVDRQYLTTGVRTDPKDLS
jgi:hypothetical protein